MKSKTLIALACVMIMALCPMACLASDSDATEDHESTAMVTFDNLSEKGVYDVFDYGTYTNVVAKYIWNQLESPLCLNYKLFDNANVTFTVTDFKYQSGESNKFTGEKEQTIRTFAKISCNFDLKMEMRNASEMSLLSSNNGYSGEAVEQMVKVFGKTEIKNGDYIEIKGSFSMEQSRDVTFSDIVKLAEKTATTDDQYYYKKYKSNDNNKLDFDVKVIINNKVIDDKIQQTAKGSRTITYDIVNGSGKDYVPGSLQAANYDFSMSVSSNGTKKIDGKEYKYGFNDGMLPNEKYGPVIVEGPPASSMKVTTYYDDLTIFNTTSSRSDSDITEKVQAYNGTATKNVSDFDKAYNKISGDFNGQSDDNTAWIVVAILVVLVIVAFIIYYLLNRMKPKTDAQEQPKEPEQ